MAPSMKTDPKHSGTRQDLTRWLAGRPTSKKTQTQGNQVDLSGGNMA
jgi:hypothetical protein